MPESERSLIIKIICLSGSLNFFNSAYPIEEYPAKTRQAAAIMLMIMNNLDARVAQVYMQLPNHHIFKPAWCNQSVF